MLWQLGDWNAIWGYCNGILRMPRFYIVLEPPRGLSSLLLEVSWSLFSSWSVLALLAMRETEM